MTSVRGAVAVSRWHVLPPHLPTGTPVAVALPLTATAAGLHEMLLQSEHRTLDPEEADYFYLPIYTSCLIFPVLCERYSATSWCPHDHALPACQPAYGSHRLPTLLLQA
jgi:hypothetical protein